VFYVFSEEKMKNCSMKRSFVAVCVLCLVVIFVGAQASFATEIAGHAEGQKHYENNDLAKAVASYKTALSKVFPGQKAGGDEKSLLAQLDDVKKAALANYQLGLIYEAKGDLAAAAAKLSNALTISSHGGAKYVGSRKCKMCHKKQYKSWEKTEMAKTFEVLKPGVRAEAKTKLKFDPKKDYTKDVKCLPCHTTGYGMPGGYRIPKAGDAKSAKIAKAIEGTTCEACHGPGGKFMKVHMKIKKKKSYKFAELSAVGQIKADKASCTVCHNKRNPTVGSDFHFDYKKSKEADTHEIFHLKYNKD
jgi:hypothetical protein